MSVRIFQRVPGREITGMIQKVGFMASWDIPHMASCFPVTTWEDSTEMLLMAIQESS